MTAASERAKRRHARPHELDSDNDDERKDEDKDPRDKETASDKREPVVLVDDEPQNLVNRDFQRKKTCTNKADMCYSS